MWQEMKSYNRYTNEPDTKTPNNRRDKQIQKQVGQIERFIRADSSYENKVRLLEDRLHSYQQSIEAWKPRFDFDLWDKAKDNFEQLWPDLCGFLYLAIEYDLYESVKEIFFDIRHLLQITGHLKERIYIADWLLKEAQERGDDGTKYLSISSLVWSYTSSGQHQNLEKANSLWNLLIPCIVDIGSPCNYNQYRLKLIKDVGESLYLELIMDIYEGGVRLSVRRGEFEKAQRYTAEAREEIAVLAEKKILTKRLRERFYLCFYYHEGVTAYLKSEYDKSNNIFKDVAYKAEMIGWTRAIKGAKSWLATLAMKSRDYATCDSILGEITEKQIVPSDKRDGICHLLKAQRGIQGDSHLKGSTPENEIAQALSRFTDPVTKKGTSSIRQLCDILSVTVLPV